MAGLDRILLRRRFGGTEVRTHLETNGRGVSSFFDQLVCPSPTPEDDDDDRSKKKTDHSFGLS